MARKRRGKKHSAGYGWMAVLLTVALVIGLSAAGSETSVRSESGGFSMEVTAQSAVRLNEVMASNESTLMLEGGTLPDWIELYNAGSEPVDLTGYALMRGNDGMDLYRFQGVEVEAGGYLMVYCDGGEDREDELHAPFKLSASGEELTLLNAAGAAVDTVEMPVLESDWSYNRMSQDTWTTSAQATPGEENEITQSESAGGMEIEVEPGDVFVSEVMTGNETYFVEGTQEHPDYIELTNRSETAVELEGWCLSNRRDDLNRWKFPEATIEGGGTLVVYCSDGEGECAGALYASFRLSGDGTDVVLTRPDGQAVSLVEVPMLEADQAYSLVEEEWTTELGPTPDMPNTAENAGVIADVLMANSPVQVRINEIAAASSEETYDWIELYNAGTEAVDLTDYGLSDNAGRPRKWQFPQGTVIQPGEYLQVICTDEEEAQGDLLANFKLSSAGGYSVVLSQPDGTVIDRMHVPQQYLDVTYGRAMDRAGAYYQSGATPGAANLAECFVERASAPQASVSGGLFATGETLTVELSAAPGARIYYTMDGSEPDESASEYTQPLNITQSAILRARACAEGQLASEIETWSYLFDAKNAGSVYTVSLVADSEDLFSDEKGILAMGLGAWKNAPYGQKGEGANFWMDWEREAHVEIFSEDGSILLSQNCGVKVHGNSTRAYDQKALKLTARLKYDGEEVFQSALFHDRTFNEYSSILLRAAGQDGLRARMRDVIGTTLASDTSLMYQEAELCIVYLNGTYWGQYYLREVVSPESICCFEGWEGQEEEIDLIENPYQVIQGSAESFVDLVKWVKSNDMRSEEAYAYVDERMDMQNFMEYIAIQIYTSNGDMINVKRYRNVLEDGKWHWVLYDLDNAFGTYMNVNMIEEWLRVRIEGQPDMELFAGLMKNAQFRAEFLAYLGVQMETTFSAENVGQLIQSQAYALDPLLDAQFERWGMTRAQYQADCSELMRIVLERPQSMLKNLCESSELCLTEDEFVEYFGEVVVG